MTKSFIENGLAAKVVALGTIQLRVFVMGCPVLVKAGDGVHSLVQLHNTGDLVSLHFAKPEDAKEPHVVTANKGAYHSSSKYLKWLKEQVCDKPDDDKIIEQVD